MWWQDAVIYQIYPRSFQDSDGDGVGDLRGIEQRLDHLAWLGVDALWLSPIYPSPMHDFGYDVADYKDVDPVFGSLDDFDSLVAAAQERGLRVLMDVVPCHTSIEHPWFREHPDWYIWADSPNNWVAAFGGSAWSELNGRYYLHSFYPEQPDLDWRNPELIAAMQDALGFWIERGIAGYRVDAIDRLMKDAELRDDPPATEPFPLPLHEEAMRLAGTHSRNAPDIGTAACEDPRGGGRRSAGGRGVPAERAVAAVPGTPRCGLCVRAAACAMGRRSDACGDRGKHAPARRRLGSLESRLRAAGHEVRARERARRGAATAHASGPRLPLPGGRDRAGRRPRRRAECRIGMARDRFRHPMQWDESPSGGFSDGRGVAGAGGPRAHQRRGPARRPALDPVAGSRPADGEEGDGRRASSWSRPSRACSRTAAETT